MARSTPATTALERAGVAYTIHEYHHDPRASSFGLEAAASLGVDPVRVFKTLLLDLDTHLVVAMVPVSTEVQPKAVARALGGRKATMADPARVERATGYVVGGVSPVGQRRTHRTVLDATAGRWSTILVSAGRRGLDLEIAPADLQAVTQAVLAPVGRDTPA